MPQSSPSKPSPARSPLRRAIGFGVLACIAGITVFLFFHISPPPSAQSPEVPALSLRIIEQLPHDGQAFTQGLLWHDGHLYESTGLRRRSSLRQVDPRSGEVQSSRRLEDQYFGEGLARVGDRLIQLTWQSGRALVWDLATLEPRGQLPYRGEGWGLCHDGERLIMSNGGHTLVFRDPDTFQRLGSVQVRLAGRRLRRLNELECVDGQIWANVWQDDTLVRIDPDTGHVTATVDASSLRTRMDIPRNAVLNGIAYRPDTQHFYLTGKNWPSLFVTQFTPAAP